LSLKNTGIDLTQVENKPKDTTTQKEEVAAKLKEEAAATAVEKETKSSSTSTSAAGTTAVQRRDNDSEKVESAKYALTKEMAIEASTDRLGTRGAVVVTWANFHYKDFVMNWVEHLKETGCTTFLVGENRLGINFLIYSLANKEVFAVAICKIFCFLLF
jgi:arabinosyltransferase